MVIRGYRRRQVGQRQVGQVDAGDRVGVVKRADGLERGESGGEADDGLGGPGLGLGFLGSFLTGPKCPAVRFPDQPQFLGHLGDDLQFAQSLRCPGGGDAGGVAVDLA